MAITTNCLMFDNQQLLYDGTGILYNEDPLNPLNLPPYTIRLLYKDNVTPIFLKGTGVQISSSPNVWDLTYKDIYWTAILINHYDLKAVLGGNTKDIRGFDYTFQGCSSLTSVALFDTSNLNTLRCTFWGCTALTSIPKFDTSRVDTLFGTFGQCHSLISSPLFDTKNVTDMGEMFFNCGSLTSIPLFDTHKVTDIHQMFYNCWKVESGALALYQQASTQVNPPSNHTQTFKDCGSWTTTGAAELAQIPSDWK
jgi:surface protein